MSDISITREDFKEKLPECEKEAFEDIFPCNKYPPNEKILVNLEQWNLIKLDFQQKVRDYHGFIEVYNKQNYNEESAEPYIDYQGIITHCPRILHTLQLQRDGSREPLIGNMFDVCFANNPNMEKKNIQSFEQLDEELLKNYRCDTRADTTEINIDLLTKNLRSCKTYYVIGNQLYDEVSDFTRMSKLLLRPQIDDDGALSVPYNKCLAIFLVLYYMRCNYLCAEFIKNMELFLGNFHGLLDMREILLKLHFPIKQEMLVPRSKLDKLADGFPTLADMKLSFYKFRVNDDGHKMSLCFSKSKSFYMNKITYSTFTEYYENMQAKKLSRYQQFRLSMIYTFKLIIPDQENFELAKSIGYIDSYRIDWQFWKDNVINCSLFFRFRNEDFLVERQYETLSTMKNRYYNFFMNLYTDYQRNFVHEPVSLVFNIAAIIFALAGVIQVLQNAKVIPPMSNS